MKRATTQGMVSFICVFLGLVVFFTLLFEAGKDGSWMDLYTRLLARAVGWLLTPFWFISHEVRANLIIINSFSMAIVPECSAIPSISIYIAAILAFPAPIRKKALGIACGGLFLLFVNLLRLAFLGLMGAYWPRGFSFAHLYLWQMFFIAFIVWTWWLWAERAHRA